MDIEYTKLGKFQIGYQNKTEFQILKNEIFIDQIYKTDIKKDSPVIFDIGSHIGLSIIYFKQQYPNSNITGFEPNPNVFHILEDNIKGNSIKNVQLHNIALGKDEEKRSLYIDNSGNNCFSTSSFSKDAWNGKQSSIPITVQTQKLSKYIVEKVDILKIDVEGAENEIIEDLQLEKKFNMIGTIMIEFHSKNKSKPNRIVECLKKNNFEITQKEDKTEKGLIYILGKNIPKESL